MTVHFHFCSGMTRTKRLYFKDCRNAGDYLDDQFVVDSLTEYLEDHSVELIHQTDAAANGILIMEYDPILLFLIECPYICKGAVVYV